MKKEKNPASRYLIVAGAFVVGAAIGYVIAFASGLRPSIVPLVSAVIGLFVAFAIPVWQALFLNVPKLSVEISSIKRTVSDSAVVSLEDYPELGVLKPLVQQEPFFFTDDGDAPATLKDPFRRKKISEVEDLLARAKQQLRDLPEQIEERRKDSDKVAALRPSEFTKFDSDRLNHPLAPEIDYDPDNKEKTLDALKEAYQKRLEKLEKRYAELQSNLPLAERKVETLRNELLDYHSFFTVSASLINSGRSNTAIKVPALLRVSIGEGNYIDIKLTLKDFENKSEITANGTRIVVFESQEISSLPEEDRKLINTYWGQSVSSKLFLEDIHSKIYSSNQIAFAEGLYQKIIYDRLAQAAGTQV